MGGRRTTGAGGEKLFQFEAVPWTEYPAIFRDPVSFPFNSPLGDQLRRVFSGPFIRPLEQAGSPRDLILRGGFARAVRELVREHEYWQATKQRILEARDVGPGLVTWVQNAIGAYADLLRARGTIDEGPANSRLADLWKWRPGDPIEVVMFGAIAGPRGAEVMYQLALCRHEQAERHQARLDLDRAAGGGPRLAAEEDSARKTWIDAEGYWKEYLETNRDRPAVAAARRMHGEALLRRGQPDEAAKCWRDVSAPMTELEALANLWRAKQLTSK